MPSEQARLPADTHRSLLTRGAAYCPALAYEVRELGTGRSRNWPAANALSALVVALAVLAAVGWAVMLTGGGQ